MGWERPAFITGIGPGTYDSLVKQGYLEEKWEGPGRSNRRLRLTEKGKRAVDEGLW
jgi:DNA-binding PadR family transcriptional regulator